MRKMRQFFLAVFAVFMVTMSLNAQTEKMQWQGIEREYIVKTPASIDRPLPVVFFLHGLGDNIENYNNGSSFTYLASIYNWVMVFPQALTQPGLGTMWNAGLINGSNIDDSGFLMALLDTICQNYTIDADSVFFTGFSMGGFMTHRMAIEHGDRINACAPVSGLITNAMYDVEPVSGVRMLHIHGTNDNIVGYDGYSQYFGMTLGKNVDTIMEYWKAANACDMMPVIDTLPDTADDGLRFVSYSYNCDKQLLLLKVIGGEHEWYSGTNSDVDYIGYIHDFFIGKIDETAEKYDDKGIVVAPNPSDGYIKVSVTEDTMLELVDVMGRVVANYKVSLGNSVIDCSSMPKGIYLLRDGKSSVKIVIE